MELYFHGSVSLDGGTVVVGGSFSGVSPFDGPLSDIALMLEQMVKQELSRVPDSVLEITLNAQVNTVEQLDSSKPAQ
jgi:hypothetical protein